MTSTVTLSLCPHCRPSPTLVHSWRGPTQFTSDWLTTDTPWTDSCHRSPPAPTPHPPAPPLCMQPSQPFHAAALASTSWCLKAILPAVALRGWSTGPSRYCHGWNLSTVPYMHAYSTCCAQFSSSDLYRANSETHTINTTHTYVHTDVYFSSHLSVHMCVSC